MKQDRVDYIDGIRGIAILLVFLAHLSGGVFPRDIPLIPGYSFFVGGGLIGVQLFFALSGYLITRNLKFEFEKYGNINFKLFYLRRLWRLYPVLLLACISYLIFAIFTMDGGLIIAVIGDILASLSYTTNLPIFPEWYPDLDLMSHTWSLSVEEQFYLLWPLFFALLIKQNNRKLVLLASFTLILITVIIRHWANDGLNYVLFRWDALMVGCLLNFIKIPSSVFLKLISLIAIGYYSWFLHEPIQNLDYLITSLACGLLISQGNEISVLKNKILIYFGKTSYSLYLWHILFMRIGFPGYINLSVSLILSDLSYRFYEVPVLTWARKKFKLTRSHI